MTFTEYQHICQKYSLIYMNWGVFGICGVPFVSWGTNIRVIPERVWKYEMLSDNGRNIIYTGEFQYTPDLISKKDQKTFENYLIKLNAWLKQIKAEQKIKFINEDF